MIDKIKMFASFPLVNRKFRCCFNNLPIPCLYHDITYAKTA